MRIYKHVFAVAIFSSFVNGCGPSTSSQTDNSSTSCDSLECRMMNPPPANNVSFQAFDVGKSYGTTLYVATNGNDSNNGSSGAPFLTLRRAVQNIQPGTEVVVRAGTYTNLGSYSNLGGSLAQPVKIRGDGVVLFSASPGSNAISFSDPHHLVLENISFVSNNLHGINMDDGGSYATPGQYVVFRNTRFQRATGLTATTSNTDCLKLSGIDNFHIEQSIFDACTWGAGEMIDMVGCHDGLVTSSIFRNHAGVAVQAKGGSRDVTFHGSYFTGIAGRNINLGQNTDRTLFRPDSSRGEGFRLRAIANVLEGAHTTMTFQGCVECEFAHNTVINPARLVFVVTSDGEGVTIPNSNNSVYNNIVYFRQSTLSTFLNIAAGVANNTLPRFYSNLWFATDNPGFTGPNLSQAGGETGSIIQQDPRFVNAPAGDYSLNSNSPAIGAGRAPLSNVPGDLTQTVYRSPPTVGAFETR